MDRTDFDAGISPFLWVAHGNSVSVCLNVGQYKAALFQTRAAEGFEGNGYDWTSLAQVFLEEHKPALAGIVKFDPEGSMFCAYATDAAALKDFIVAFKAACEDDVLIQELFSKAVLD